MKDFSKEIYAYALRNAIEFGSAEPGKILPKLFQHGLDKKDIKKIMPQIQEIVKKVNSLDKDGRQREFSLLDNVVKVREEKEKDLPELPNAGKGIITRIPPEPSKYLHLGHALSFLLNYLYAKKYDGKCLIRFEDANPEKVSKEYVDAMLDDINNYLGIKSESIRYVSDDIPLLYNYAEKLISQDKAYMCFCDRETMQELRHSGKECAHRKTSAKDNLKEWKQFLAGKYKEGEAVLRIKGDMKHTNHVMRDSALFRMIDKPHFRQKDKYKVWPLYDFYNPIEDSLMGITHVLRTNEFEQRVPLQDLIKDLLGLKKQTVVQYGRFSVIDATTKGREIRELIESGEYIGWDDPRLMTLRALRRRGIRKDVLYELVKQIGLSKYEVHLDFDMIAAISRKLIDADTERYYFVEDPVELEIEKKPKLKSVKIPIHPDKEDTRNLDVGEIFISEKDLKEFKGKEVRLLHLFNVKLPVKGNKAVFTSMENKPIPKIQWVSSYTPTKILMPNAKWVSGFAEAGTKKLKADDLIQFERFGFVRLDAKKKDSNEFWYTHR
ncbi:glutamate--tRNA ligase [Candidatus Pacearchaeota archaeon]|nr:glutamate--tRNA ligase [Candidatus Pacearchaeota archaeon]